MNNHIIKVLTIALCLSSLTNNVFARSYGTQLCLHNNSNTLFHYVQVYNIDNTDWDGDSRPDHNFNNVVIAPQQWYCQHEELNRGYSDTQVWFNFKIDGEDNIRMENQDSNDNLTWSTTADTYRSALSGHQYGTLNVNNYNYDMIRGKYCGGSMKGGRDGSYCTVFELPMKPLGEYNQKDKCSSSFYNEITKRISVQCKDEAGNYILNDFDYGQCNQFALVGVSNGKLFCQNTNFTEINPYRNE